MTSSAIMKGLAQRYPATTAEPPGVVTEPYRVAAKALADMQRYDVNPTAQAYELWFAYHAGTNPTLTRRMGEVLRKGHSVTQATIDSLREEFEFDTAQASETGVVEHFLDVSTGLEDAAAALVQHAAAGRMAIRTYGEVLADSVVRLTKEPGVSVIPTLTSETVRMAENNRMLREQLSFTSARVEKLRRLLADERLAASTDVLTGLANRRAFNTRVKRTLAKVAKEETSPASLLALDIDHFKRFNDLYGHSTGDLVLRLVGRLLIESIKGRDIAARYGGEEFAILLIDADIEAAATVARQICMSLADKRFKLSTSTEQGLGRVTISIGVAQLRPADTLGSAMERADAALYAAKHAGRNRVITETELRPP